MYTTATVLCVVWCCYAGLSVATPVHARGAMSYVVERGCPFLSHYVRNNYYDYVPDPVATVVMTTHGPSPTTHINWVTHLYDTLRYDYVPMELFKGLMNCGKEYAMFAIDASANLKATLGVDYGTVPGIGK